MAFFTAVLAAAKTITEREEAPIGLAGKIASMLEFFFDRVPYWIAAFVVFIVSIGIAKMMKNFVEGRLSAKIDEEHQEVLVLAGRLTYVGTLALGITVSLKIAGIDITTILAAVAFGIGFALRDLIMNFIAGIYLLVSRQFTIGDFIKVGNVIGKVVEIQTRATILKSIDGTKLIVPNAELFSNSVTSFTSNPMRRVVVPLYVAYGTDLDYAIKIAMNILHGHEKILKKPAPSVIIKDYGDSSIDLAARFWVPTSAGWVKIRSEVIKLMDKAFFEAGIHIPYETYHLETSTDIKEEESEEQKNEKLMKEKLGIIIGNGQKPELTAEPVAEYLDQTEIDDQTIDNQG